MRSSLYLLLSVMLLSQVCMAGSIKGKVTEKSNGETAVGATIYIKDHDNYNAVAGLDGSFEMNEIPDGDYILVVTYINSAPYEQDIHIEGEQPLILEIAMSEKTDHQLNEVVIGDKRDGGSEKTARRMEQKADQVMNIVSAKAIQISPDITVANVIQRVSGVSIERNSNGDGQHAILRGMDKRYNYTMVNGVKIPSPDNKYRYVPLDLFPAELLDRLEVYKSLVPSQEGDAIGGAINMVMKDAPNQLSFSANLATGYSELFFDHDFKGFDNGGINSSSPWEINGKRYQAAPTDFPSAPLDYTNKKPLPNLIGGFSFGNRYFNNKFGIIVAGSYQNTYRGASSTLYDQETVDTYSVVSITKKSDRFFSEQQTRSGLHVKLDYRLNSRNKLKWYNAYMGLNNIQVRDEVGKELSYGQSGDTFTLGFSTRSRVTNQHIYNSTLQGEHQLTDKFKVDWSAVYSKATNERPENTEVSLSGFELHDQQYVTFPSGMTRRWEHNSDRDIAGYLNLTYKQSIKDIPVELKIGGLYRDKARDNFFNNYSFNPADKFARYGTDFDAYNQIEWTVATPGGAVNSALTYQASEKIAAGYFQFNIYTKRIELVGGVRVEHTDQGYNMLYPPITEDHPDGKQIYTDVLPSLNFKYILNEKANLRATYFRGINRPGFAEIVPYKIVNEDYQERGNYNLKHAVADNVDLRYELFPHAGESFLLGAFYKRIQNPIEFTLQIDPIRGQDQFYGPANYGTANNYGLELDFVKFFNKIGFKGNYTYTHSAITTTKAQRVANTDGSPGTHNIYPEQTRPLYGQAAHIANLSLLYKDVKHGWDAQLAGNYTGSRIATVSQFIDRDIWQKAFIQMDFSMEKSFHNGFAVFAKVNNILNTPMETFIKGKTNYDPKKSNINTPGQDLKDNTLVQRDYYQRSYLIGLRYKL
ncbi:TonB-dependent receptor plug domain-containing protein [Taibaiella lutea]|uniref:TonB-dependent receptor plug domain-containing protein n=1 Tax=Taibaiella lutea TaxID=2608001 RepID=A0A5M6CS15_9BACT|nr:TonB-dependent receptor [Taibaiella lutea]KAA5537190.1 TonB-dependent receptor plug domain-containing protein [Taibaiella lutea]